MCTHSRPPRQPLVVLGSVVPVVFPGGGHDDGGLTGKNLEGSGEEEASALLQGEELAEEQEEGQAAEDDGEDHESLDRLDPLCRGGGVGGGEG